MILKFNIVIPARLASQRLPRKPLLDVAGKTLIERVYDKARLAAADSVVIATDSGELARLASDFGAAVVMTSAAHTSGSDRVTECADKLGWADDTLIVNLQGDEPLMPPACLNQAAALLATDPAADVASLYWPVSTAEEVQNPNAVKVVVGASGYALYFSRSAVPYPRDYPDFREALRSGLVWKRHIGLYAYRAGALRAFSATPPTTLEATEKLEQLRFLETGRRIIMAQAVEPIPPGVDTPADLRRVRGLFANAG